MATVDVWEQCRAAIAGLVEALGLTDPKTGLTLPVYRSLWSTDLNQTAPCLEIAADDDLPDLDPVAFGFQEVVYPVVVLFKAHQEAAHDDAQAAFYQGVFKEIQNQLRKQLLPGVPTVWRLRIRPIRSLDRQATGARPGRYQQAIHALLIQCDSVEPDEGVAA